MTGELFINGYDAYTEWGLFLTETAFATLICPPPVKDYLSDNSRLDDGRLYLTNNVKQDERTVSLDFYIKATTREDMYSKLISFTDKVLSTGEVNIETNLQTDITYRCVYKKCQQMQEFNGRLGKFQLTLVEPEPTRRKPKYTLSLDATPTEGGTVEGSGEYSYGITATVVATPNDGYDFVGWSDGGDQTHAVKMKRDISLTASFVKHEEEEEEEPASEFALSLTANPTEGGTVSNSDIYARNTVLAVTATADDTAGYKFVNWTDSDGFVYSTRATCTVIMTTNLALIANFTLA